MNLMRLGNSNLRPSPGLYLGPFLIGTVVSAIFFGMLCLQCYVFFKQSGGLRKHPLARSLIAAIWLLSSFSLFSSIWTCYLAMILLVFLLRLLRQNDFLFLGFYIPYGTMYANALLGFLNTRFIAEGSCDKTKQRFELRGLSSPIDPSTELAIHAEIQHAKDDGVGLQTRADIPLTVHVETTVEMEKLKTAL
ncbi:uncharacterized protein PHACADRAFT_212862 [Phanerochaete carnosa HHB-10118-sp]|uniref:Uncharacterized protein n=1 Tax=Phanerochaete carnosa (strain HHB-10118-sp) TaxID=650164 RepID=K5VVW7_PHACS|nr:uncharacterized protein PHACADRAFT_212862 [Phanerochaete carnosa HHB-10118-sp]EKM50955.1 hypothetical protein PHACADRAFT_212862 [Phanerochaete carnosa HHB-10118-sp]